MEEENEPAPALESAEREGSGMAHGKTMNPLYSADELYESVEIGDVQLGNGNGKGEEYSRGEENGGGGGGGGGAAATERDILQMQAGEKFNLTRRQHRVRKALDSVAVQSCLVIMLLIDLCLLIVDVSAGAHAIVSVYSIVLVSVLSVELVVRIYAYGGYFVKDVMNIADLIVVVGSVLVLVLFDSQTASIVNLGRMARAVRSGWQTLLIVVKVRNRHTRTRMCVYVCVCVCVCPRHC